MMKIIIKPRNITILMTLIVMILALMHIFQLVVYFKVGDPDVFDFIKLVDFDYEGNLPSLYSSIAMIYCALLLLVIARSKKQENAVGRHHWFWLAVIFLYLGVDEGVGLHEDIGDLTEDLVKVSGFFYFAWVIPYGILLLAFVISYIKFLMIIPKATAIQFVIAGCLFVGGAMGIEMFSAKEADLHGTETVLYSVLYTVEELFEMFAIILFANTLMNYIADHVGSFEIFFNKD